MARNTIPETPAELLARARFRDEVGHELQAKGLYGDAERHWRVAAIYRLRAEMMEPAHALP